MIEFIAIVGFILSIAVLVLITVINLSIHHRRYKRRADLDTEAD